jgi:hypothetical protein
MTLRAMLGEDRLHFALKVRRRRRGSDGASKKRENRRDPAELARRHQRNSFQRREPTSFRIGAGGRVNPASLPHLGEATQRLFARKRGAAREQFDLMSRIPIV